MVVPTAARAMLLASVLGVFACGAEPEESSDDTTADELQGTVRVRAWLEAEFSVYTSRILFSSDVDTARESICYGSDGQRTCITKKEFTPDFVCEGVGAWAKPGILLNPAEMTVKLLGLPQNVATGFPRAHGDAKPVTDAVGSNTRVTCTITEQDSWEGVRSRPGENAEVVYEIRDRRVLFTLDVPANTPGLEKVDGKVYDQRFDLPDYIPLEASTFRPDTFRPDPAASWVEAGRFAIHYDKLQKL